MKATQKIASITLASCLLFMQPANATGIPVVDGALATLTKAQNMWVQVTQYAAEVKYYANMVANWDVQLKSLIAEKIDELKGENNEIGLSKAEKDLFFQAKRFDCEKSSNTESAKLCRKMVKIEELIAKRQDKAVKDKADLVIKINAKIAKRNSLANNAENKEKIASLDREIQRLNDTLNSYDTEKNTNIADLERDYAILSEARQRIVRNQLKGTDNLTTTVVKTAMISKLQSETNQVRSQIQQLKTRNDNESNNALHQNSR